MVDGWQMVVASGGSVVSGRQVEIDGRLVVVDNYSWWLAITGGRLASNGRLVEGNG